MPGRTERSGWPDHSSGRRDTLALTDGRSYRIHTVKPGETLFSLSRMFGVPVDTIRQANAFDGRLRAGMVIRIPYPADGQQTGADGTGFAAGGFGGPGGSGAPGGQAGRGEDRSGRRRDYRRADAVPRVALMLPLKGTTAEGNDFIDFYRGALLALEDLKKNGRSLDVSLFDTARSTERVSEIVRSPEFYGTDLIIGPVYEDEIEPALLYADEYGVPVVSPLATVRGVDGGALYQMAPDPVAKYVKMRGVFSGGGIYGNGSGYPGGREYAGDRGGQALGNGRAANDGAGYPGENGNRRTTGGGYTTGNIGQAPGGGNGYGAATKNIILVSSPTGNDAEFEREITAELAALGAGGYGRFTVDGGGGDIASLIDWERENVFVVLAGTELAVDRTLASISSAYNNASARRGRRADITVVGNSKWALYNNSIDKNLFFKLNVQFVTSYYINHSNAATASFERRYLDAYGDFTSRAAYRGYDAVTLFAGALFEPGYSFDDRLERVGSTPVGTPYRFVKMASHDRRVNVEWTLVKYSDDYNITVE